MPLILYNGNNLPNGPSKREIMLTAALLIGYKVAGLISLLLVRRYWIKTKQNNRYI